MNDGSRKKRGQNRNLIKRGKAAVSASRYHAMRGAHLKDVIRAALAHGRPMRSWSIRRWIERHTGGIPSDTFFVVLMDMVQSGELRCHEKRIRKGYRHFWYQKPKPSSARS